MVYPRGPEDLHVSTLAALALATPIFGFALQPPSGDLALSPPPSTLLRMPVFAQVGGGAGEDVEGDDAMAEDGAVEGTGAEGSANDAAEAPASEGSDLAAQLRMRQEIGTVHRAFGIATWGAMLATVALGFIQYYNLYGFGGSLEDNPCVNGEAIFGQDQCWGTSWPHRVAAITTATLYTATFVMSFVMPDPLNVSEGDGAFAQNMRIHKALRWVHLGGMLAQMFLGLASAQNWFGIDRANDFEASQALASAHLGIGLATFGVMTAAGALMVF